MGTVVYTIRSGAAVVRYHVASGAAQVRYRIEVEPR
jgi:hypothetical protein